MEQVQKKRTFLAIEGWENVEQKFLALIIN